MFTSLIMLAIQLLPQILNAAGVITPSLEELIQDLGGATTQLITSIATGAPVTDDFIATIKALRTEVASLQTNTNLSPEALQMCATLLESTDAALAAYEASLVTDDPTTLQPLPTDL